MASNDYVRSEWQELLKFSKEMNNFAEKLETQMKALSRETSAITSTAWRDKQGARFAQSIEMSKKDMLKSTQKLKELSVGVEKKARELKEIEELRIKL